MKDSFNNEIVSHKLFQFAVLKHYSRKSFIIYYYFFYRSWGSISPNLNITFSSIAPYFNSNKILLTSYIHSVIAIISPFFWICDNKFHCKLNLSFAKDGSLIHLSRIIQKSYLRFTLTEIRSYLFLTNSFISLYLTCS